MSEASRKAFNKSPVADIDLTKPLKKDMINVTGSNCFGKEWDMGSKECPMCAASEVCGIVFAEVVNKKAADFESSEGYLLDQTDFKFPVEEVKEFIRTKSGVLTAGELIDHISEKAKTRDKVAVVEWIKRFVKSDTDLYIQKGIVHHR